MIDLVSFIIKGEIRRNIVRVLVERPVEPKKLAKELNTHVSTVSRNLIELSKEGIAECINPNQSSFRIYKITSKGIKVVDEARKLKLL